MAAKIVINGEGGLRIRIKASSTLATDSEDGVASSAVSVRIDYLDYTDPFARIGPRSDKRRRFDRSPDATARSPVSPAMEAAAIRAFLSGADATRLGRALSDVYRAMEAVRLQRETDEV